MTTLGIFADEPNLGTGFSIVCGNFADYLNKKSDLKVIYFGRWGNSKYFKKTAIKGKFPYDYVPCRGGTWDKFLVSEIIKHYNIDILLTEDDWWSIDGLLYATKSNNIPFHLITPIDGLPIPKETYERFRQVNTVYIPNRSWSIVKLHDKEINVKYLPHGCNTDIFKPYSKPSDKFTFLWIGRNEPRKSLKSAILACREIKAKDDMNLLVRTNWTMPNSILLKNFIIKEKLPVIREQSTRGKHEGMVETYNKGHVLLCTSMAGGFELQILEAMGCEVPVLATDWNFMNEHIINEQNGFKIPYKNLEELPDGRIWANIDEKELAKYMEYCINHQDRLAEMGRWAKENIKEKYKWEDCGEVLYKSIAGEKE